MKYQVADIIRKKRAGESLSEHELSFLLDSYLRGEVADYHMSAWLMAVFFQGMDPNETRVWSRLMWKSGITLPRSGRKDFWVDKHSTGGVGDKTSLLLVPLVQSVATRAFGEGAVKIPMVSGRGLDFTGGTLDKLEAVPGFRSDLDLPRAMALLESQGFMMMGQTEDLAPADRRIYALRDVTATVECLPLIVSSILSKKLAENLDGIVFDVKFGSGAFLPEKSRAMELAVALCETARGEGLQATALLTSMEQPLGRKVGHQLEVEECIDYLRGVDREHGLHEVTLGLAAEMLIQASKGEWSASQAIEACGEELASDRPAKLFEQLFTSQGGDWKAFESNRERLQNRKRFVYEAERSGYLSKLDARGIGRQVRAMGGGRQTKDSTIDLNVGAILHHKIGDRVERGDVLVEWICSDAKQFDGLTPDADGSIQVSDAAPVRPHWIEEIIRA